MTLSRRVAIWRKWCYRAEFVGTLKTESCSITTKRSSSSSLKEGEFSVHDRRSSLAPALSHPVIFCCTKFGVDAESASANSHGRRQFSTLHRESCSGECFQSQTSEKIEASYRVRAPASLP